LRFPGLKGGGSRLFFDLGDGTVFFWWRRTGPLAMR
jgi:hypothetical protein